MHPSLCLCTGNTVSICLWHWRAYQLTPFSSIVKMCSSHAELHSVIMPICIPPGGMRSNPTPTLNKPIYLLAACRFGLEVAIVRHDGGMVVCGRHFICLHSYWTMLLYLSSRIWYMTALGFAMLVLLRHFLFTFWTPSMIATAPSTYDEPQPEPNYIPTTPWISSQSFSSRYSLIWARSVLLIRDSRELAIGTSIHSPEGQF